MSMRMAAGDIGGTKVLLQLAKFERGNFRLVNDRRFESAPYSGLTRIVREFLDNANTAVPSAALAASRLI